MNALAFITLLAAVSPNPVMVAPGETAVVEANAGPFLYGASFSAEDASVAEATGRLGPGESGTFVSVRGLRVGETRMILTYASGFSVWRVPVADIVVNERCEPPTVALSLRHVRIAEGSALTVTAMTTGTEVRVEWYEGTRFRRVGPAFTLRGLPHGTHRFTARASNGCGVAMSEELVVEVVPPRRRSVRR